GGADRERLAIGVERLADVDRCAVEANLARGQVDLPGPAVYGDHDVRVVRRTRADLEGSDRTIGRARVGRLDARVADARAIVEIDVVGRRAPEEADRKQHGGAGHGACVLHVTCPD